MPQTHTLPVAIGLDIGSTAVRCVIGLQEEGAPAPSIIGVGVAPTSGVRKGVVVDVEDTVSAITAAIDEAERISGITVNHATIGVNGGHLLTVASHGIIAVGGSREITPADVARAEEAAAVMQLPPNREILQIFPVNYIVDGQEHVKDPVGMSGMRLEVDSRLVTGSTPFLKNLARSVFQGGVSIDSQVGMPLASAQIAASKRLRELGCLVVDIGSSTTGIAVFEEGELMHMAVLPVGSAHITNDIAIGLRTDIDTAEKIKIEHVNAGATIKDNKKTVKVKELSGEIINPSIDEINEIAQARLEEIFELVDRELRKIKREGMLPGGVLLCGGGANLAGVEELAKKSLRLPARIT